ncbi:MAG: 50S ribosomal protein L21 [Armatimonadota bacterium]
MYAIVETGGKQYRVSPGDTFRVEKLPGDPGTTLELDRVLMVADEANFTVGAPMLDGAKVVCTVLEQDRGKKLVAIRYKAKKNVRVRRGHRQYFTRLRVDSIEA